MLVKSPRNITRAVLAKEKEANMVMVMAGKKMTKSILAMLLIATSLLLVGVEAGSNFADSLAECSAVQELNICLREVVIGVMMMVVEMMVLVVVVVVMVLVMVPMVAIVVMVVVAVGEKNVWQNKSLSRSSFRHCRCSANAPQNWSHRCT